MFCGPETVLVTQTEAEGDNLWSRGPQDILFSEVPVNKCFVIYQVSFDNKNVK